MVVRERTWSGLWVLAVSILCAALVYASLTAPEGLIRTGAAPTLARIFAEVLKLAAAAALGMVITSLHKRYRRDRMLSRSMEQAQVLLCVAGALMMILIGDSIARAFGIAGGAAIVRFRTPVEDPKDSTVLFLLLGIGMACGLGALGVAGLATLFLGVLLFTLDRFGEQKPRVMMLNVVATGAVYPGDHVHAVLARSVNSFETREVLQGAQASAKYLVTMDQTAPLNWLSQELISGGNAGVKSVSWEIPKKELIP